MAEAIAVVAVVSSIVQLIDFTSKVVARLDEFHSNTTDTPKSLSHLRTELPLVTHTLQQIRDTIQAKRLPDRCTAALQPVIEGCDQLIRGIDQILGKTLPKKSDGKAKKAFKAVGSVWNDDKIEITMKTLRGYIGTLTFYLTASQTVLRPLTDEKFVKIRQWLSAPDPSVNLEKALKIRQSNTGLWFLESDVYRNWKADASLVWLHGIPGCGKTILTSTVLEDIRQQTRDDPGKVLAYFYFDFNDRQKQSSDMLVRSLVAQLTKQCIKVPESLDKLFSTHDNGYQQPSQTLLLKVLHDFMKGFPHVYLVIDALDECEEREELMNIVATVAAWQVQGLHVLLTSRREGSIKLTLESLIDDQNIVCIQTNVVDRDIKLYVREQLTTNESFRKWQADDAVRQQIENCVGERARGMFRLAACQLDMIKRCRNRKQLDRDLETLPSDLDETYNRILETIKGDDIIYATRILRWLAFSRRPLTLAEVAEVAALDPDRRPAFDRDEVLEEHDDILAICSSLVTIVAAEQTGTSQSSTALSAGPAKLTVILAHYSVKEYLVSKRILESGMSKYGMEAASCHRIIARCCVQYLLQFDEEGILTEENLHHFALAQYSAQRWITHSELGKGYDVELVKVVVELLMEKEQAYLAYFRLRNLSEYGRRIYFGCSRESLPEPLYFASMTGMSNIVQSLIDAGADVNAKGGICGTALQAASFKGWLGVVKSLIENGADVNAQGGQYGTALQATLSQGRLDIGRFLVEKGADVNARGGEHGNALQAALHDDDLGIVRFLVENGADVNMQGGKYCNALQTALHEGGLDVVEFLVKNGADLKTQGGKSLELAAKRGRLDMMKVLVEHGADLNTQSLGALRVASKKGRLDMIRFLVENGADLNSQAGKAIWAASYHDDLYILAVLIVHGADLKAQGSRALREALRGGHVDAIRSLVGADVDLKTHGSKTLMLAAGRGHLDVVKFLIDNGVDVNAPSGSWYENALEAASNGGHLDVIKILVESGADINAPIGGHWGGALAAASAWDYLEVVEFLVEHGADLETHGSRVLDLASRRGSMKVERFLVAKGVQRGMETQFWWQDSSC